MSAERRRDRWESPSYSLRMVHSLKLINSLFLEFFIYYFQTTVDHKKKTAEIAESQREAKGKYSQF